MPAGNQPMKIKDLFEDKVITVSNFLTLVRILAVPFIAYWMIREFHTGDRKYLHYQLAGFAVIIISDFFDGYLARLLGNVSRLGQFLDPVADKVTASTLAVFMVVYKGLPMWIVIVALSREVFVIFAAVFLFRLRDVEVEPNLFGKMGAASMAFCALVYTLSLPQSFLGITIKDWAIYMVLFFYVGGVLGYVRKYAGFYFEKP